MSEQPTVRPTAVLAVLVAVVFVVLVVVTGRQAGREPIASGPTIVPPEAIAELPAQRGHDVYWAGPGENLELTVAEDGSVYVRYLPDGEMAGTTSTALTVATYPRAQAYAEVRSGGLKEGAVMVEDSGGALVTAPGEQSTSAYFAFEGVPLLVEVFDPQPGRALELIQSGQIQAVARW